MYRAVPASRNGKTVAIKIVLEIIAALDSYVMQTGHDMDGRVQRFACKKCGKHLLYAEWGRDNYCSKCGQAVKWE